MKPGIIPPGRQLNNGMRSTAMWYMECWQANGKTESEAVAFLSKSGAVNGLLSTRWRNLPTVPVDTPYLARKPSGMSVTI